VQTAQGVAAAVTSQRSREAAYADLVAGLLDLRSDPATERFDAELVSAEDDGRVDAQTAKVLRWWQRESLRTLVEHASTVVPPTMLALETAAGGSQREVESSAQSWARASADESTGSASSTPSASADSTVTADTNTDTNTDTDDAEVPPPTDLSEHRRRLLVAGLTRVRP
jgi:hypothetical protein